MFDRLTHLFNNVGCVVINRGVSMQHCVLIGSPTLAFKYRFKRAVELFGQYSLQELNLPPDDLARKAVKEAGFIEQDPDQDMLERMVMAYQTSEDQELIIETAWNAYNT